MSTDIESRVAVLEIKQAVRNIVHQKGLALDVPYDADAIRDVYTSDAAVITGSFGRYNGSEQYYAMYSQLAERIPYTFHVKTNGIIEVADDRQSATGRWFGWEAPTVGTEPVIGGLVEQSEYKPENGVWLISSYAQNLKFLCPYADGWKAGDASANAWQPR